LRKHRLDILRLQALIAENAVIPIPAPILADFKDFLTAYADASTDPSAIGIEGITFEDVIAKLDTFVHSLRSIIPIESFN